MLLATRSTEPPDEDRRDLRPSTPRRQRIVRSGARRRRLSAGWPFLRHPGHGQPDPSRWNASRLWTSSASVESVVFGHPMSSSRSTTPSLPATHRALGARGRHPWCWRDVAPEKSDGPHPQMASTFQAHHRAPQLDAVAKNAADASARPQSSMGLESPRAVVPRAGDEPPTATAANGASGGARPMTRRGVRGPSPPPVRHPAKARPTARTQRLRSMLYCFLCPTPLLLYAAHRNAFAAATCWTTRSSTEPPSQRRVKLSAGRVARHRTRHL